MARALARLLLPVLMLAAACGPAGDNAAAGGGNDSAQQAAAPAAGRDTAQAREEVLRLEEEFFQALVRRDPAPAQRILAEDYVGITGDGDIETKAQVVAAVRGDSTSATAFLPEEIQLDSTIVRVHGDAAVALARGTARGRSGGQPVTFGFRTTDVFAWRDGRWQLVASHFQVADVQGRSRTQ